MLWYCFAALALLWTANGAAVPEHEALTGFHIAGELRHDNGAVTYLDEEGTERRLAAADVRPYAVVSLGPPALVTVIDEQLQPTTWAIGDGFCEHDGLLPLIAQPPLTALNELASVVPEDAGRLVLLDRFGEQCWSHETAQLLWPAADTGYTAEMAYIAAGSDGDAIYWWGEAPDILAVDTRSGEEHWRMKSQPRYPPVNVQLWGLSADHGLLCLQYNSERYEFCSFNRETGEPGERWPLHGQPGMRLVYPGAVEEPAEVTIEDNRVTVLVFTVDDGWQHWRFDLEQQTLDREAADPLLPAREDNALPVGGDGAPSDPPFAQRLLPVNDAGSDWLIPALVDAAGRVLVIDANGPQWISRENRSGSE